MAGNARARGVHCVRQWGRRTNSTSWVFFRSERPFTYAKGERGADHKARKQGTALVPRLTAQWAGLGVGGLYQATRGWAQRGAQAHPSTRMTFRTSSSLASDSSPASTGSPDQPIARGWQGKGARVLLRELAATLLLA